MAPVISAVSVQSDGTAVYDIDGLQDGDYYQQFVNNTPGGVKVYTPGFPGIVPASEQITGQNSVFIYQVDPNTGSLLGDPSNTQTFTAGSDSGGPGDGGEGPGDGGIEVPAGSFVHGDRVRVWINDLEVTIGHDPALSLISIDGLATMPERRVETFERAFRQGVLSTLRANPALATWAPNTFTLPFIINGSIGTPDEQGATAKATTLHRRLLTKTSGLFTLMVQNSRGEVWTASARRTGNTTSTYNKRQWWIRLDLQLQLDVPMWADQSDDVSFEVSGYRELTELGEFSAPVDNATITIPGGTRIRDVQSGLILENRGGSTLTVMCSPTYAQNPIQGGTVQQLRDLYWNGLGALTIGDGTGTPILDVSGGTVTITCQRRTLMPL